MARPRKINGEQRQRLAWIAAVRSCLPSRKQLAYECGVAERTIAGLMSKFEREFEQSGQVIKVEFVHESELSEPE